MRIEGFDPAAEPELARACYEIYVAGLPADDPGGPALSWPVFCGWFTEGWNESAREAAMAAGDDRSPAGAYLLELPEQDNTHLGYLSIMVAPGRRRRGYGTGLLRHAAERAAGLGRRLLAGETVIGSPGSGFAAATGARAELVEIRRVLELADVATGRLAALRRRAEAAARGYSLLSWTGPTPGDHLEQVATVLSAMADAPRSPGEQPRQRDAQRVRDGERRSERRGMRRYTMAARCDQTGELAGLTQLGVDSADPAWGHQFSTVVTRAHRGHRLGLLVKVAMLEMLAEAEPGMRRVHTGNADSNQHMIAINAELGFKPLGGWQLWELDLPAAAPAS